MLAPSPSLPWKIRAIVSLHRSTLILPPSSLWRKLSTLKLSPSFSVENTFLRVPMFEYYICYKILLYFPSFALSVTLTGQFRLQLNSSFRLAFAFRFQHVPALAQAVSCRPLAAESRRPCGICGRYMVIVRTISPSISDFLSVSYHQSSVTVFHLFIADTSWRHWINIRALSLFLPFQFLI
jgi:hypothetical protein